MLKLLLQYGLLSFVDICVWPLGLFDCYCIWEIISNTATPLIPHIGIAMK